MTTSEAVPPMMVFLDGNHVAPILTENFAPHPPPGVMFNPVNNPPGLCVVPNGTQVPMHEVPQPVARPRKRNRKTLSCLRCHRIKLSCDREKPCRRCKNTGRPEACQYQSDISKPDSVSGSQSKSQGHSPDDISIPHPSFPPPRPPLQLPPQTGQQQWPHHPIHPSMPAQHPLLPQLQHPSSQPLHTVLMESIPMIPNTLMHPPIPMKIENSPEDDVDMIITTPSPGSSHHMQVSQPIPMTVSSGLEMIPISPNHVFSGMPCKPENGQFHTVCVQPAIPNEEPPDFLMRPGHVLRSYKGGFLNVGRSNWAIMSYELRTRFEPEFLENGKYYKLDDKIKRLNHFLPKQRWPNFPLGSHPPPSLDAARLFEKLVAANLVVPLLNSYFKTVNITYPIEFRCRYMPKIKAILDGKETLPGKAWRAQFFLMVALGAIVSDSQQVAPEIVDDCLLAAQVDLMSESLVHHRKLDTIRALILMVVAKIFNVVTYADGDDLWPLVGFIARIMRHMSLHRDPQQIESFSTIEKEERRRIWWSFAMIDIQISIEVGQSTYLNETQDFDTRPPLNVDEDLLCSIPDAHRASSVLPDNVAAIIQPDSVYTTSSYLVFLARIAPQICAVVACLNSQVSNIPYDPILKYHEEIRDFLVSIATVFVPGGMISVDSLAHLATRRVIEVSSLQLLCRRVMLALHQHYVCDPIEYKKYATSYWTVLTYSIAVLSNHQVAETVMTGVEAPGGAVEEKDLEIPKSSWFSRLFFRTIYTATLHVGLGLRRGDFKGELLSPTDTAIPPEQTAWKLLKDARLMHEQIASISFEHFQCLRALALGSAAVDAAIHELQPFKTVLLAARRVVDAIVRGRGIDWNEPVVQQLLQELDQDEMIENQQGQVNGDGVVHSAPGGGGDPSPGDCPDDESVQMVSLAVSRPVPPPQTTPWISNCSLGNGPQRPIQPLGEHSPDKDSGSSPVSSLPGGYGVLIQQAQ